MVWKLEARPLTPFPADGNPKQTEKAEFEISKALARHRITWGFDHKKVIQREDIENALRNNPDLQIGAFLVGPNHHTGKTNERLLGVVTVARFNPRRIPLNSPYDVIRGQHDPKGSAISCFIVSVKHRKPNGFTPQELNALIKAKGGEKLVDVILNEVHKRAESLFRKGELESMYAWSTPAGINESMGIPQGQTATLEQIVAHLNKSNDRVIHGTHVRLGAQVDGIVPNGRPNSEHLTGAGALVRMKYELK